MLPPGWDSVRGTFRVVWQPRPEAVLLWSVSGHNLGALLALREDLADLARATVLAPIATDTDAG